MQQRLSRRTFLKASALSAGTLALAACTAPAAAPAGGEPAAAGAVELKFWTHSNSALTAYVEKKVAEYQETMSGVAVEYTPTETAKYDERLFTSMAAGTGPDGFNSGDWNFPLLNTRDWLGPVTPEAFGKADDAEVQDMFFDFSLTDMVGDDGLLYAIPLEWNALHLYYNRGAFTEAGFDPDSPPTTWEEVTDMAVTMTQRDDVGNITFPGFQQHYGPGTEWPFKRLHPMLVQAGQDFLSENLDACALTEPEAIEVIEYYTAWTTNLGVAMQGFEVPGVSGSPFRSGYGGMDLSGSYNTGSIKRANPDWEYGADDGWDISNFPQWSDERLKQPASAMWRWGAFVNSQSENPAEAWSFIHFLVEDSTELNSEVGYIPSLKGWLDDPANIEAAPWLPIQKKDLEIGVPVPQTPQYQQLAKLVLEMLERVYDGSQTVSESVAEACGKIDNMLADA